jgi:hypothetical protein
MQKSVREWTFTLPSELTFWELESRCTPESSKGNCKGQNSLDWRLPYIIEKLLKCNLKWARMTHLDNWNTSYGHKLWPLQVRNRPNFLTYKWRAIYYWKALDKSYNFALDLISIGGLHTKLWAPKSQESQLWEFRDSHLGVSGPKAIWMLVLWLDTEYTTRGKVVVSPKFGPWWILWIRGCSWFIRAAKCSNYALTNLLFGFVHVCVSKWIVCQSS